MTFVVKIKKQYIQVVDVFYRHMQQFWGATGDFWQRQWGNVYNIFGENEFMVTVVGESSYSTNCILYCILHMERFQGNMDLDSGFVLLMLSIIVNYMKIQPDNTTCKIISFKNFIIHPLLMYKKKYNKHNTELQ